MLETIYWIAWLCAAWVVFWFIARAEQNAEAKMTPEEREQAYIDRQW